MQTTNRVLVFGGFCRQHAARRGSPLSHRCNDESPPLRYPSVTRHIIHQTKRLLLIKGNEASKAATAAPPTHNQRKNVKAGSFFLLGHHLLHNSRVCQLNRDKSPSSGSAKRHIFMLIIAIIERAITTHRAALWFALLRKLKFCRSTCMSISDHP
jgi:hypothetical protein